MAELREELETLEKELNDLIENYPSVKSYESFIEYDRDTNRHQRAVISKQEMAMGIMRLIIRQLESKQ